LFKEVASTKIIDKPENELEFNNIKTNFRVEINKRLVVLLKEVSNTPVSVINDDYSVKIALKDDSTYAFVSRCFAYNERLQIRQIDDLLNRAYY